MYKIELDLKSTDYIYHITWYGRLFDEDYGLFQLFR